jgi:hypothetical protein
MRSLRPALAGLMLLAGCQPAGPDRTGGTRPVIEVQGGLGGHVRWAPRTETLVEPACSWRTGQRFGYDYVIERRARASSVPTRSEYHFSITIEPERDGDQVLLVRGTGRSRRADNGMPPALRAKLDPLLDELERMPTLIRADASLVPVELIDPEPFHERVDVVRDLMMVGLPDLSTDGRERLRMFLSPEQMTVLALDGVGRLLGMNCFALAIGQPIAGNEELTSPASGTVQARQTTELLRLEGRDAIVELVQTMDVKEGAGPSGTRLRDQVTYRINLDDGMPVQVIWERTSSGDEARAVEKRTYTRVD